MRRRETLQQLGLVASLASVSGCAAILGGHSGDKKDDGDRTHSGNLEVAPPGPHPTKGKDGNLVVAVAVKNTGKKKESADLKVTVEANGAVHERTPKISVSAGEKKDIKVPFKIDYDSVNISIDLK